MISSEDERLNDYQLRDESYRDYLKQKDYVKKQYTIFGMTLGLSTNVNGNATLRDLEDIKEFLNVYKQTLIKDTEGNIVDHQGKDSVLNSIQNSIDSMGYQSIINQSLENLQPNNNDSFLIVPRGDKTARGFNHLISTVIRKQENGDFEVVIVDKNRNYNAREEYVEDRFKKIDYQKYSVTNFYIIDKEKREDLSKFLGSGNGKLAVDFSDQFMTYKTLEKMSKTHDVSHHSMSEQKTGNCFIKEVEAGLKYALWSREGALTKDNHIKWPFKGLKQSQSATLEVHRLFKEAYIDRMKEAGYGNSVIHVLKDNFASYENHKKVNNYKKWQKRRMIWKNSKLPQNTTFFKQPGFFANLKIKAEIKSNTPNKLWQKYCPESNLMKNLKQTSEQLNDKMTTSIKSAEILNDQSHSAPDKTKLINKNNLSKSTFR